MDVDPQQVIAFRLAGHGLAAASADPLEPLRGWATQDELGAGLRLAAYGPSTRRHFGQWAGLGTAHAGELWAMVDDECSDVRIDGEVGARVLTRDLARLKDPPTAHGVRLIAPGDPLLLGRDRERLLPDAARRKQVWRVLGGSGLVLSDGRLVALWRGRKQGKRLQVAVDALDGGVPRDAIRAEAERLAAHRGCAGAEVV
ncbi:MAG: hypothetical protein JWO02_3574 [Solirubrobacterales bacterium]|nr:hypothetical protein [Solirubrobacterales bacterium]